MSSASPAISSITFPPRGATIDRAAANDFVGVLRSWQAEATDRVFALDAQLQSVGPDASPTEQADVADIMLSTRMRTACHVQIDRLHNLKSRIEKIGQLDCVRFRVSSCETASAISSAGDGSAQE